MGEESLPCIVKLWPNCILRLVKNVEGREIDVSKSLLLFHIQPSGLLGSVVLFFSVEL